MLGVHQRGVRQEEYLGGYTAGGVPRWVYRQGTTVGIPGRVPPWVYPPPCITVGYPPPCITVGYPPLNTYWVTRLSTPTGLPASCSVNGLPASCSFNRLPASQHFLGLPASQHLLGLPASSHPWVTRLFSSLGYPPLIPGFNVIIRFDLSVTAQRV